MPVSRSQAEKYGQRSMESHVLLPLTEWVFRLEYLAYRLQVGTVNVTAFPTLTNNLALGESPLK